MLFAVIPVAGLFAAVEFALLLAGVVPQSSRSDPLVGFSRQAPLFVEQTIDGTPYWVTASNKLRWFNQQQFAKSKSPNTVRIFCVGGSTVFGRPYDDQTSFAGWLRELLPVADSTRRWEVINAGGISYASYRLVKVMEELAHCDPDWFVVYTGHNEFLEERTYRDVRSLPPLVREFSALLNRSRGFTLLSNAIRPDETAGGPLLEEEVKTRLDSGIGPDDYHRDPDLADTTVSHFRYNLNRMIEIAEQAGARIAFVTPASNLAACSPFKSELSTASNERLRQRALAEQVLQAGNHQAALTQLDNYLKDEPLDAQALYSRGQALLGLGRYEDAREALLAARDQDVCPLRATTRVIDAVRAVARENDKPLIDFVEMVAAQSEHGIAGESWFLDHVHPTIEGHRKLAVAVIDQLAKSQQITLGQDWNEQAIARVAQAVESRLDRQAHGEALRNLAKVLSWAGKTDDANRLALQAAAMVGGDAETLYLAGNALLGKGEIRQAIQQYEAALQRNPNHFQAINSLGSAYQMAGDSANAIQAFERAIQLKPDFAPTHSNLGAVYASQHDFQQAAYHYQEAIRFNPRYSKAHNNLGVLLRTQEQYADAAQRFAMAIEIDPEFAEAYFNLGTVLERQGAWSEAFERYQQALTRNPKYGPAWHRLGIQLERRGELPQAVAAYQRALRLPRPSIDVARRLAWLLATGPDSIRDGKQALRLAQDGVKAIKSNPVMMATLAAAYAETEDFAQAVQWQQRAIQAATSNDMRQSLERDLEQLQSGQPIRSRGASTAADD